MDEIAKWLILLAVTTPIGFIWLVLYVREIAEAIKSLKDD